MSGGEPVLPTSHSGEGGGGGTDWWLESAVGILSVGVLSGRVTNVITR